MPHVRPSSPRHETATILANWSGMHQVKLCKDLQVLVRFCRRTDRLIHRAPELATRVAQDICAHREQGAQHRGPQAATLACRVH
jgi:hypothetical protein